MNYAGGCLCGAVRWSTEAEPVNQRVCHCRLCQKATGAPFYARLLFREADVTVSGAVSTFPSSPGLQRGFCPTCGTTLMARRSSAGTVSLSAGSLDDPALFRPGDHIWTASRQPWLCLADGLDQHVGAPPP